MQCVFGKDNSHLSSIACDKCHDVLDYRSKLSWNVNVKHLNRLISLNKSMITVYFPGIGICAITGMAALFLSEHYGAPAMLFALLLGMAVSFLYQQDTSCKVGIEFTGCHLLRAGVALLGLRVAFGDLVTLGWKTGMMLAFAIISTIVIGMGLSKLMGMQKRFGALTGGAVGICGASAALAISAVLPADENKERDTLLTVIGVTALSTLAMVVYPILVEYAGLNSTGASIFLGGTIHDVAQVVGAGYSISEQTGDLATLTKLVRVAMLMPVVLCFVLLIKRANANTTEGADIPSFPSFLVFFVILMTLNSLADLPSFVIETAGALSQFFLIVAITAIGMKSNLGKLVEVGIKPILLMAMETLWIALLILVFVLYFL